MNKKKLFLSILCFSIMLVAAQITSAAVATFDDLVPPTPYTGPMGGAYYNGSDGAGGFASGDYWFNNNYNSAWGSWDGWAYSNTTDTTTAGYTNQYSAITGGGVNGSSNYGVAYCSTYGDNHTQIIFGYNSGNLAQHINGFYVTNTTYATLSMLNGDYFAKKFGGDEGTDPDWFKLTIYALDSTYEKTDKSVEFYLADYRFDDPADDYIVTDWRWVDLSFLGVVNGLEFELSSSDVGAYGMNTPAYFAMDNLTGNPVPIPGAVWLLGSGLCGLIIRRRLGNKA